MIHYIISPSFHFYVAKSGQIKQGGVFVSKSGLNKGKEHSWKLKYWINQGIIILVCFVVFAQHLICIYSQNIFFYACFPILSQGGNKSHQFIWYIGFCVQVGRISFLAQKRNQNWQEGADLLSLLKICTLLVFQTLMIWSALTSKD